MVLFHGAKVVGSFENSKHWRTFLCIFLCTQDVQEQNSLFTMIAYHSGSQFSYEAMSKESGVRKDLLRKYIEYFEAAFLIKVIMPIQ